MPGNSPTDQANSAAAQRASKLSAGIASWLYPAVKRTLRVRRIAMIWAGVFVALGGFFIAAANPYLRLNFGANTIDHVDDRRLGSDYGQGEARALAVSDQWLALATASRGLALINRSSRVVRDGFTDSMLDVTRGPGSDDFLALGEGQEVIYYSAGLHLGAELNAIPWLTPTAGLGPPGISQALSRSDLATGLDATGWLLAAPGLGITRYRFTTLPDGRSVRTRNWEVGPDQALTLTHALIDEGGIWYTPTNGGIRYADRISLKDVARRSAETPPIARLEAAYGGQWASALDAKGGLWLMPGPDAAWLGPYFGDGYEACSLQRLEDVTMARWQDPVVWLGTSYGLFAYDTRARRIRCLPPDFAVLDVIPDPEATVPRALVVGGQGVVVVAGGPTAGAAFVQTTLDRNPVTDVHISADRRVLIYRAQMSGGTEIRMLKDPLGGTPMPQPLTLSLTKAWATTARDLAVVGVEPLGQGYLFATSAGAFLYEPGLPATYRDLSTAQMPSGTSQGSTTAAPIKLSGFTSLISGTAGLLAAANGRPLVLDPAHTETGWQLLSSDATSRDRQVVQAAGQIVGLGEVGDLHTYGWPTLGMRTYLTGTAPAAAAALQSNASIPGDLRLAGNGAWDAVFLASGSVATYDTATGRLFEESLRLPSGYSGVSQVRLVDNGRLYLLTDGRVANDQGALVFGAGSLPFTSDMVTALASARERDAVLLGGPKGEVVRYNWANASSTLVGSGPLPGSGAERAVVDLQETTQGVFAVSAAGGLYFSASTAGQTWNQLSGYRDWVPGAPGGTVWAAGTTDVARLMPAAGQPPKSWPVTRYGQGSAMRSFIAAALFAWQLDASRIAFFGRATRVGLYDVRNDTWDEVPVNGLQSPTQFAVGNGFLLVLDGLHVVRVERNLQTTTLLELPMAARNATLHLDTGNLLIAYVDGGEIVLRRWDASDKNLQGSRDESTPVVQRPSGTVASANNLSNSHDYRRGGKSQPENFDPAQVIWAREVGGQAVLAMATGAIAAYSPSAGRWESLRNAEPGQSVYGLLALGRDTGLVLSTDGQEQAILVRISGVNVSPGRTLPLAPVEVNARTLDRVERGCFPKPAGWWPRLVCDALDIPARVLALPAGPIPPADGPLLEGRRLRVIRAGGITHYERPDSGAWQPLTLTRSGFSSDQAAGLAFTASGRLVASQGERLVALIPAATGGILEPGPVVAMLSDTPLWLASLINGDLVAARSATTVTLLNEGPDGRLAALTEPAPMLLAALDVAGRRLEWRWQESGKIVPAWQGASSPAWGAEGHGLDIQEVEDLALDGSGRLLVSTAAGLMVRDAISYTLQAFYPNLPNLRFERIYNPEGLRLRRPDGSLLAWVQDASSVADADAARGGVLATGPWSWQPLAPGGRGVSITDAGGQPRRWRAEPSGAWRFEDDVITWIGHSAAGQLVLTNGEGAWSYTVESGRGVSMPGQTVTPAGERRQAGNVAMTLTYEGGQISVRPAGDWALPLFVAGRFFFDRAEAMAAAGDALYLLVPGRGVARRDPRQPGALVGFWPLPAGAPRGAAALWLESTGNSVRLWTVESVAGGPAGWALDPTSGTWQALDHAEATDVAVTGAFAWRYTHPGPLSLRPYVAGQALSDWWVSDRFAWDRVTCAGPLNSGQLIAATAAGTLAWSSLPLPRQGYSMTLLGPPTAMNTCLTARTHYGQVVGMTIGNEAGAGMKVYSGDSAAQGQTLNVVRLADVWLSSESYRPVVYWSAGYGKRSTFEMVEIWQKTDRERPTEAFGVSVMGFSGTAPFVKGQFAFDRASGAALLGSGSSTAWFTYGDCQEGKCVLGKNIVTDDGRLLLDAAWPDPLGVTTLRPAPAGRVFSLQRKTGTTAQVLLASLDATPGQAWQWQKSTGDATGEAYRMGSRVTLDAAQVRWSATPAYLWEAERPAFTLTPTDYSLFVTGKKGSSLAFDAVTSLAFNRTAGQLALGTQGGVFLCPWDQDGHEYLALDRSLCSQSFTLQNPAGRISRVTRVRYDQEGQLWVTYGSDDQTAYRSNNIWQRDQAGWPRALRQIGDLTVERDGLVCKSTGKKYTSSNDAWGLGRRPLTDIVDLAFDQASATLWLASRYEGVFKIIPDLLPSDLAPCQIVAPRTAGPEQKTMAVRGTTVASTPTITRVLPASTVTRTALSPSTATRTALPAPTATRTALPASTPAATQVTAIDRMVQVLVPAGEFLMGSADSDKNAESDEKPQHKVTLDAYWIDRTEVTRGQYDRCVAAGKCAAPETGDAGNKNHPVVGVTWDNAAAYCAWAGRRLPTEAEWEKAARGTDGRMYPWGNAAPDCGRANYAGKSGTCAGGTTMMESYPAGASPYGVLDMAGNVWEWVSDWYGSTYYSSSPVNNPTGPQNGQARVLRGGGWSSTDRSIQAMRRNSHLPMNQSNTIGFRCAVALTPVISRVPSTSPVPTASTEPELTVNETVNVRAGPGTNYTVIGQLVAGAARRVTGRTAARDWWQIEYDGRTGWVSGTVATVNAAARNVLVAVAPPTPTALPTQLGSTATTSAIDGMVQLLVPAGEFLMGAADSDKNADRDEKPQHKVTLDAYWIDRTEVTRGQYERCVAAGKCAALKFGDASKPDYPAEVDWQSATAYCAWAGRRLPTEAEWEKAARGTDGRLYPWGNATPDCKRANYGGGFSGDHCVGGTMPVGSYPTGTSPYGALDMAGNAWEWVNDWYDSMYYTNSPTNNPAGPQNGQEKVLRGGDWFLEGDTLRVAERNANYPSAQSEPEGFRCAAALKQ
jgi:formylglycine-generating enzyme required for sulfatase activity